MGSDGGLFPEPVASISAGPSLPVHALRTIIGSFSITRCVCVRARVCVCACACV